MRFAAREVGVSAPVRRVGRTPSEPRRRYGPWGGRDAGAGAWLAAAWSKGMRVIDAVVNFWERVSEHGNSAHILFW